MDITFDGPVTARRRAGHHRTPVRRRPWLAVIGLALLMAVAGATVAQAATDGGDVYVAEITGEIDLGLAPYLDRVLDEAEQADAAAVLLEVDTPGGRLDAVLQMQDALLDTEVPTIAFVEGSALSAGALTTIASDEIYLSPGATLGAATPVTGEGDPADEKTISAVAATFASTAEATGRDPRVAEAMVDRDIAIDGLVESGELLTLSPDEALGVGYGEQVVPDREAALAAAGLADVTVAETGPQPAESLARFLTDPVVASLLVVLAMWLLIADLTVGGIGLASGLAAVAFGLFFWGHLLAGLAGWEEVVLVGVGLALIALELLVVPGVGIPGLLGLAAVLGGMFAAQLSPDLVTDAQIERAAIMVGVTFVAILVGLVGAVRLLSRYGAARGLVLDTQLGSGAPVTERATGGWVRLFGGDDLVLAGAGGAATDDWGDEPAYLGGRRGVTVSSLRPSGVAEIDGERVDVVTAGEYVEAGEPVEVIRDDGYRRVVARPADVESSSTTTP
jgi:membrane-bound serine protease (ClpP class)